jgi:hypothetical protein
MEAPLCGRHGLVPGRKTIMIRPNLGLKTEEDIGSTLEEAKE